MKLEILYRGGSTAPVGWALLTLGPSVIRKANWDVWFMLNNILTYISVIVYNNNNCHFRTV